MLQRLYLARGRLGRPLERPLDSLQMALIRTCFQCSDVLIFCFWQGGKGMQEFTPRIRVALGCGVLRVADQNVLATARHWQKMACARSLQRVQQSLQQQNAARSQCHHSRVDHGGRNHKPVTDWRCMRGFCCEICGALGILGTWL